MYHQRECGSRGTDNQVGKSHQIKPELLYCRTVRLMKGRCEDSLKQSHTQRNITSSLLKQKKPDLPLQKERRLIVRMGGGLKRCFLWNFIHHYFICGSCLCPSDPALFPETLNTPLTHTVASLSTLNKHSLDSYDS